jgi:hypothetical protein
MFIASLLLACVLKQASPPTTQPAATPLLAGPTTIDSEQQPSILEMSFNGSMAETVTEPDRVAIGKLELSSEQRMKFEEIHAARLTQFDQCVKSNYGLVVELGGLQGESDNAKRLKLIAKVREAFEPYTKRGSFMEEMSPHLTPEQKGQTESMVQEYRQARVRQMRREMGQDATLAQIGTRARLEVFGQMLRESVERQVGLGKEQFEQLAKDLDLSEEQKAKALSIFGPIAVQDFQGNAKQADRLRAFTAFRETLNPEQRRKLWSLLMNQWKPEAK